MASTLPLNVPASKASNSATQPSSTSQSQAGPASGGDSQFQRRSGGSGSFGTGAAARTSGGAPRNKQGSRNQNKQSRRFRLADEDAIAESAAMNSTKSRKGQTSITHLMNFSLPPRPPVVQQQINHRYARKNPTWGLGSGHHAVDKARYVHANYRFIVDPRHDYQDQSADADMYLDWSTILQILASPLSQAAACPICLGDPVAPRMAKCGHIFCLHCLIRYMHSTDDVDQYPEKRARWKKCPICWDSVYISETRPVRWYIGQEGSCPREGEDIVLRLVMRPAGSTLALPNEGCVSMAKDDNIPWHFAVDVMDYARVMKGTEDYMLAQFDEEIEQLEKLQKYDELMYGDDTEWTSKAARAIRELKDRTKGVGNAPHSLTKPDDVKAKKKPIVFRDEEDAIPSMYSIQHAASSGQSIGSLTAGPYAKEPMSPNWHSTATGSAMSSSGTITATDQSVSTLVTSLAHLRSSRAVCHGPSDYYFYQALLHYYLAPLDIRILRAAFGDFSSFPSTILPRVERMSTGHVVDDDLRKRAKYLSHLPHGCEVNFLECDWTDTVAPVILEKFRVEIERRRKKNQEKEVREEKERLRAEKEEDDKRYAAARRKHSMSSEERFRSDDFQPLQHFEGNETVELVHSGLESTSPLWIGRKANGLSFTTLASPSTSPNTARTVWGTTAIAPVSPVLPALPLQEPLAPEDGWLEGWQKELLLEDNLTAQVEAASLTGESSKAGLNSAKKKKGKKIILMNTNARRAA